jgi:uncharacterized protein (TIGR02147 family)
MKTTIYDYLDYKKYLNDALSLRAKTERGPRARLAEFIGCHLAYLSQVLNGSAHLSLEQAEGCNRFFTHTKVESLYFLNLVHYARAGTENLKKIYHDLLKESADEQKLVKNRLDLKKTLSPEKQAIYYSAWDYLAIHTATVMPHLQTKNALSEALGISEERVAEVLEYLVSVGLVSQNKGKYEIAEYGFHLGTGSPFLVKHHTNWRVQSLRSLDNIKPEDLHYTSVISCNNKDVPAIRETLLKAISEIRSIVKESKNEDRLMSYCLDLFPITKR